MEWKVKFLDLSDPPADVVLAAIEAIKSGWYVSGPRVDEFEREWATYCGAAHCVGCSSGGAAITLALRALEVPAGARVVIPALTFAATAMAVLNAGAQPVYCDVDEHGLMDVCDARAVAEREKAWGIIPVHLYGQLANMHEVVKVALELRLRVVEDACQAHGALFKVQGDMAAFSFYPGKNLGAFGEAGAVLTDDRHLADKVRALANYGVPKGRKYHHQYLGDNLRMDEVQAAVLSAKLKHLNGWNARRLKVAERYRDHWGIFSLSRVTDNCWHLYPAEVKEPEVTQSKLAREGIATGRHYPRILPEQPALFHPGNWPSAVRFARFHLTLPMGPHLSMEDADYVGQKFNEITGG